MKKTSLYKHGSLKDAGCSGQNIQAVWLGDRIVEIEYDVSESKESGGRIGISVALHSVANVRADRSQ